MTDELLTPINPTASCHAIANDRDEGVTKLLFHDSPEAHGHGKILGGDMIGQIALAIEMGAYAVDICKTIHPHPPLALHLIGQAGPYRERSAGLDVGPWLS
jgi:pyruvate/2-oxoglutarate dehydrogenase complex dihydrolipoamide dehydrogenase (E3) component